MPEQPGRLQTKINSNGGTDFVVAGTTVLTVNSDGSITFPSPFLGYDTFSGALKAVGFLGSVFTTQSITGDGAITVPSVAQGVAVVTLSKGSVAAITLADAVAGDVGKCIIVHSSSAYAHVITAATSGFNGKGSSGTATCLTPFVSSALMLVAIAAGNWFVFGATQFTIA
jgi:hypothetical protein